MIPINEDLFSCNKIMLSIYAYALCVLKIMVKGYFNLHISKWKMCFTKN